MTQQEVSRGNVADAVGAGLGEDVISGQAELRPVPVPGTEEDGVWLIRNDRLDHPLQAYVGRWPDGTVRLLSDDQAAWMELMDALGVRIDDPDTAIGYVRQFLEITRGPSVLVREVAGVEDLRWRPGSAAEEQRREAFLTAKELHGPITERTADGYHVELTLVVDQRVQRNSFEVAADGRIAASFRVLAEDLPLPIAR